MLTLRLSSQLSDAAIDHLWTQPLSERYYKTLIQEPVAVRDIDGALVAVLVKNAVSQDVLDEAFPHLSTVMTMHNTLSNRGGVIRAGAQMNGIRIDGIPSARMGTPKTVLKAHGGQGTQLGYFDFKGPRGCRETAWTVDKPEALLGCGRLIAHVDNVYRQTLPVHYARQLAMVEAISPSLKIKGTNFTTVTVNYNNRTAAHTDTGDVRDGMGCMTTHGSFKGGHFIMPKFEIAFDVEPGDVLLANVHEMHGNSAMSGDRLSCVYYARERMHLCTTSGGKQ